MQLIKKTGSNSRLALTAWAAVVVAGVTGVSLAQSASPTRKAARPASGGARQSAAQPSANRGKAASPASAIRLSGPWQAEHKLTAGQTVEISVHLERPSALPTNGRVAVEWVLDKPANPQDVVPTPENGPRKIHDHEIYTAPTANWRKVLHALDGDVYVLYRAPVSGTYRLRLVPVTDEQPVGATPRWREKGNVPDLFPLPDKTPWPAGTVAPVSASVKPIRLGTPDDWQKTGGMIEVEPNDTPEQAQRLVLEPNDSVRTYEITGTADDIEFYDNGKVGQAGDDWFRVELKGNQPQLVTAQLGIPGQFVVGRIRCYQLEPGHSPDVKLGALLPISEFRGQVNPKRLPWQENKQVEWPDGQDPNERVHQQDEQHRINISRLLEPGKVYYFRVEANAPGYQLQVRVLRPSPYSDPRMAIRQGMYTQIGQVDAWLSNRPRGAAVERRLRDTGNLLGTQCMSCHTQSGIWGPAVPMANGYRVENVQNFWHLTSVMYECLRPTNELKDAANNTSLAPLDIGDGPAGTRAAGFNIVNLEGLITPRKLHGKQQIRTANFVLQTNDPGGINAAGPGSNVGQNIVWLFAGEILNTAWKRTGDPKYFRALEDKARKVAELQPKFTDDVAVRMDFFGRLFPLDQYPKEAEKAAAAERAAKLPVKTKPEEITALVAKAKAQLQQDEARIRAIQNEDGTWGFNPGSSPDNGKTWKRADNDWDPAPTALAVTGLTSLGYGKNDPAIAKGVQALLRMQDTNGRWNKAAITGFVTSAYALRALGTLYPVEARAPQRADFLPKPGESLTATVRRVQALALTADPKFNDLLLQAARHPQALVRYWALIGLGATHQEAGVPVLLSALKDKSKVVRDAAVWGLRQTLLDDHGWAATFTAYDNGDDYTREGVIQALGIRADAVMPKARLQWPHFMKLMDHAMNADPHPAVRAWATKAAWQWWVWNPPVRERFNQAWVQLLTRKEPNALVEHTIRYSSQALFVANGHRANGSKEHQYKELATLFEMLLKRLEQSDPATKSLMARRLVGIGGTFFQTAGGDGGPGQMGYITPGSGELMGQAVLVYMRENAPSQNRKLILAGLEGAANIPHRPLQEYLIDYALKAPEDLRQPAAAAVSDPRSAMLQAATELVEPLIQQVQRGAVEPARRPSLSDPVIKLFSSVNWIIPDDQEQQRHFFDLMIPKFERYYSPAEINAMPDAARKAEAEREMNAAWYLADSLGSVLAANPDLHREMVFRRYIPTEFRNPLERHFWVRSVPWVLEHKLPEQQSRQEQPGKQDNTPPDPGLVIKDRALQLYLDALKPEALPQTRDAALRIANTTAVRQNPEVIVSLQKVLEFEKNDQLRKIAENVVKQGTEKFVPDLIAALKAENKPGNGLTADGKVNPTLLEDITFFRDYIIPELARVKRSDQASCMGCHAIPGRVPSFFLKPVDEFGYLSVMDLLFNYREMQARVNLADLERSKILRKPLNVQDGQEDGHQGGRRYLPQDEGYLLLKRWVDGQPKVLQALRDGAQARNRTKHGTLTVRARAVRPRESVLDTP